MVECIKDARNNSGNMSPWHFGISGCSSFIDKFESVPGVACFDTVEQAVKGLAFCYRYHQAKMRKTPAQRQFPVDLDKVRPLAEREEKRSSWSEMRR